jgi:hypothetical protein
MKNIVLFSIVFAVGLAVGGYGGHYFSIRQLDRQYSQKLLSEARFYDETRLLNYSSNAFAAYLHQPPAVGIYELQYHLAELDQRAAWADSNLVFINHTDINWKRAAAHVRLANLYAKMGQMDICSNHLAEAWQSLTEMRVPVTGVTNQDDLVRLIQQFDKKGTWW